MADAAHSERKYDRDFLLSPEKRNQLIELWEVEKYGRDCFGDPDHVRLYGMKPKEWYERGVRILGRTCLEAVKDPLGDKIGSDISWRAFSVALSIVLRRHEAGKRIGEVRSHRARLMRARAAKNQTLR